MVEAPKIFLFFPLFLQTIPFEILSRLSRSHTQT